MFEIIYFNASSDQDINLAIEYLKYSDERIFDVGIRRIDTNK